MQLIIILFQFSFGITLNLGILNSVSTSNFTLISLSEANWFVMGKYDSYADIQISKDSSLSIDCEICSIDSWFSGQSDLLTPPLDLSQKSIYISTFQYSKSEKSDIKMLVQSNENTKCFIKLLRKWQMF